MKNKRSLIIIVSVLGVGVVTVILINILIAKKNNELRNAPFAWEKDHKITPEIVNLAIEHQEEIKALLGPRDNFLNTVELRGAQPTLRLENGFVVSDYNLDISLMQESVRTVLESMGNNAVIVITKNAIYIDFPPEYGIMSTIAFFDNPEPFVSIDTYNLGGNWYYTEIMVSDLQSDD